MLGKDKTRFNLSVPKDRLELLKEMGKLDHNRSCNSVIMMCIEMAIEQIPELQELAQKAKEKLEQSTNE